MKKIIKKICSDSIDVSWELVRIIVPVAIGIRLMQKFGVLENISGVLDPLMQLVGLPGEVGIVWLTGMLTNLYAGLVVFSSVASGLELSIAQVTVLGSMMLIAHSLGVELLVAKRCGVPLSHTFLLRFLGALIYGALLSFIYFEFSYLQELANIDWIAPAGELSWGMWALSELKRLFFLFLIILALNAGLEVFNRIGVTRVLEKIFSPMLYVCGIGSKVGNLIVVGMVLGISYGGGLLIKEAQKEETPKRDVYFAVLLLSLCHSLFEDVALIALITGGHLSGLLWGRVLFTVVVIFILQQFAKFFDREKLSSKSQKIEI